MDIKNLINYWAGLVNESVDEAMSLDDILNMSAQKKAAEKKIGDEEARRRGEEMEGKRIKTIEFTSVEGSDYRPSKRGIRWNDPMTIDVHYTIHRANGEKLDEKERFSADDEEFRKMRTYLVLGNNLTTDQAKGDIRFDKYHVAIAMVMRAYNRHSKHPIEWKDEVDWAKVYADEASGKTDDKEARTDMTGGVKNFDDWKITDVSQLFESDPEMEDFDCDSEYEEEYEEEDYNKSAGKMPGLQPGI